jgi:hypothetical protein
MDLSSKILKGSCTDVPDPGMLLLHDGISDSVRFLLIEGTWVYQDSPLSIYKHFLSHIFQKLQYHLHETTL